MFILCELGLQGVDGTVGYSTGVDGTVGHSTGVDGTVEHSAGGWWDSGTQCRGLMGQCMGLMGQ